MNRLHRRLLLAGIVTVIACAVVTFPARVALHYLALPGIEVNGIGGSVWNGSIKEASVGGMYLRSVKWELRPTSLLTLAPSFQVSAIPGSGFLDAQVSIAMSGDVLISDLKAALPLTLFADTAGIRGLQGDANLAFSRIELRDGFFTVLDGSAQISNLLIPPVAQVSLGNYKAEFFTQNNGIVASLEDTDAVLDLAGSLQIKADRSFEFLAQVIATSKTPDAIRQRLSFLPAPNSRGQQEIRLAGIL